MGQNLDRAMPRAPPIATSLQPQLHKGVVLILQAEFVL